MATASNQDGDLFEAVLRKLSTAAFRLIVNHGVRDIDAFLNLDRTTLPNVSSGISAELLFAQQWAREQIDASSVAGTVTEPGSPVGLDPVLSEGSENGETGTAVPTDKPGDSQFVQTILDNLGVRARHALAYGKVSSFQQFMDLDSKTLEGLPNTGAKTIAEIMEAQSELRDAFSKTPEGIGKDQVSGYLERMEHPTKLPRSAIAFQVIEPTSFHSLAYRHFVSTPVDHSGDPAEWSILRATLPQVYGLTDDTVQDLWLAFDTETLASLGLDEPFWTYVESPPFEWDKLETSRIYMEDALTILLSLTVGYLVRTRISGESFSRVVEAFRGKVKPWIGDACFRGETLSDQPIMERSEIPKIGGLRIDSFDIPEALVRATKDAGVSTWSELEGLSERSIVEPYGFGLTALKLIDIIWTLKPYLKPIRMQLESDLPSNSYTCFHTMIGSLMDSAVGDGRDKTIMLGRLAATEGKRQTLDQLGAIIGVTRERVRQIEHRCVPKLRRAISRGSLARFLIAIDEELRPWGVRIIGELAAAISRKFDWADELTEEAVVAMVRLLDRFKVDTQAELVYYIQHRCQQCPTIVSALNEMFVEFKAEKSVCDVSDCLLSCCRQRCENELKSKIDVCRFADDLVRSVASRTSDIKVLDGWVYSGRKEIDRSGTRTHLVESIVQSAGQPMHFSEVYQQAKVLLPDDPYVTEHNVYSWMGNSRELVLWHRGTYIHRDFLEIPKELIKDIERWLQRKLESAVPFVSVAGAYSAFEEELVAAGVPSESALYSCLRASGASSLAYPRYPYVVLNQPGLERLPVTIALEQFVQDAGGVVSLQDMRAYAVDDLCISDQLFWLHVYDVPNILRLGNGTFIHAENLNVERTTFEVVLAHAQALASKEGHVSVEKVFADKQVTCLSIGIDSPELLYGALQLHVGSGIQMPGFPQIVSVAHKKASGVKGILDEVADYIALKEGPCSFEELEQHFVDGLGYSAGTVYNVVIREAVVRYSRGSVVHLDTVEWTDDKQRQLEAQARDALDRARAAGRCFASIDHLIEYHKLPDLANGVVWTRTLLSELLPRGGRFEVLGNARDAYVSVPNEFGVETFEDLVCQLLKTNYEGACELESFEKEMREAGIVQKRLTPGMLGDQRKVRIKGHLIMLEELCDA